MRSSGMAGTRPSLLLLLALGLLLSSVVTAAEFFQELKLVADARERHLSVEEEEKEGTLTLSLMHRDHPDSPFSSGSGSSSDALRERLERDRRRVEGIMSRVNNMVSTQASGYGGHQVSAQENTKKEKKRKHKRKHAVDYRKSSSGGNVGFEGAVVSGLSAGSGEYFVTLGVGTPQTKTALVMDTGSDLLWLQCAPCRNCYNQNGAIFQPKQSRSYRTLACGSKQCQLVDERSCAKNVCLYEVNYGDGSFTVGDFSTETLTLTAKGGREFLVKNVGFGCGHDNEGLFIGAAGLLGLGRGSLSFPSQVGWLVGNVFSYCLVDRESLGSSSLAFGQSAIPQGALFTPLLTNPKVKTFYYVGLVGFSVGKVQVPIPANTFALSASGTGGVIIDSGTSVTRLPSAAYTALRNQFVKMATSDLGHPSLSFSLFDTCYDLGQQQSVQVPVLSLLFQGGVELPLPARNYMVQVDSQGTVCFAFAPTSGPLSIIGNIQQMSTRIVHDVAGSRLGFAPSQC